MNRSYKLPGTWEDSIKHNLELWDAEGRPYLLTAPLPTHEGTWYMDCGYGFILCLDDKGEIIHQGTHHVITPEFCVLDSDYYSTGNKHPITIYRRDY